MKCKRNPKDFASTSQIQWIILFAPQGIFFFSALDLHSIIAVVTLPRVPFSVGNSENFKNLFVLYCGKIFRKPQTRKKPLFKRSTCKPMIGRRFYTMSVVPGHSCEWRNTNLMINDPVS